MKVNIVNLHFDREIEKIVNLTPHDINIVDEEGNEILKIPRSGNIARIDVEREIVGSLDSLHGKILITRPTYGNMRGLPHADEGVIYVVSSMVRSAFPDRQDLVSPGGLFRNEEGMIVGCRSLDFNMR